jgi:sugar/nucleoside kinase (ribokinase family)
MPRLLIVGGLTIDRFADGSRAPGGSVIHSGRAAAAEGVHPAILTVAGDEPEAREGIAQLRSIADVIVQPAAATTSYRHEQADGRRVLVLEAATDPIVAPERLETADVVLFAPIGGELPTATIETIQMAARPRCAVMLIQGWLRRLEPGKPVHPLPLDAVPVATWSAFESADAIVLSTEDLAEAPEDPFAQAAAVRNRIGDRPLLVLTLGPEGYLLDDPAADRIVAAVPRSVIEDVSMVGAGDAFGASLAIAMARGAPPNEAADAATERVIRMLQARRS